MELREAVEIYCAKAPVCLCGPAEGCNRGKGADWCGPQRKAHQARRAIEGAGFKLPALVGSALSHAFLGDGREEFDDLMQKWRAGMGADATLFCPETGESYSMPRASVPGKGRDLLFFLGELPYSGQEDDFGFPLMTVLRGSFDDARLEAADAFDEDINFERWADAEDWCKARWKEGRTVLAYRT